MNQIDFWTKASGNGAHFFIGAYNRLAYQIFNDGPVIICFDPWFPQPDDATPPFGFEFFSNLKMNVIAVKSLQNDWYQSVEFDEILAVIDSIAGGRERIGYGSSMGAYAALNFAQRLRTRFSLLFSPQASIDPQKVPFEKRYRSEAAKLTFHNDTLSEGYGARGVIFYDPRDRADREHAKIITGMHRVEEIQTPYFGHETISSFGASGVLPDLIVKIITTSISKNTIIELRRKIRPKISRYFIQMAEAQLYKRKLGLAALALQHARVIDNGDTFLVQHFSAVLEFLFERPKEAGLLWSKMLSDSTQARRLWWLIGQSAHHLNDAKLKRIASKQDSHFEELYSHR